MSADITLVNMNMLLIRYGEEVDREFHLPLGCLYLIRALEDAGFGVDFRDYQMCQAGDPFDLDMFLAFLEEPAPIIGLSCMVNLLPFTVLAARALKERYPDRTILLGGVGPKAVEDALLTRFPWISVIENNGFQIWVRASDVYAIKDLARRADGYGIEGRVVDGNDVLAVYNAAKQAVQKARNGGGPTIIECKTYRWYDHYGVRGAKIGVDRAFGLGYRSDQELRDWMAKDPVRRFREHLLGEKVLSAEAADKIVEEVREGGNGFQDLIVALVLSESFGTK